MVRRRDRKPWKGARPGSAAARQDAEDELLTLVAFDIPSDKVRHKFGEVCGKDLRADARPVERFRGANEHWNRREEPGARLRHRCSAPRTGEAVLRFTRLASARPRGRRAIRH